jgi:2-methylcitrate dehydratase PrpD
MAPLDCTLNVRSRVSDLRARTADRMVLTVLPYMEDHVRRYPSRFVPGATVKDYRPDTPTSARFDMPYLMAASWYAGRFDERLLHPPAREDAQTLALRERIETVAEDGLEFHQARLDVFFADGTTEHEWVGANHGSPANPFQDQDFEAKFRRQAQGVIDDGAAAAVLDAAWRLDQLQHATELTSLLRAA